MTPTPDALAAQITGRCSHVSGAFNGCVHCIEAALTEQAREIEQLRSEWVEWLCEQEQTIHPSQRTGILQRCPNCGDAMLPTSQNLREIERLKAELTAADNVQEYEVREFKKLQTRCAEIERATWEAAATLIDSGTFIFQSGPPFALTLEGVEKLRADIVLALRARAAAQGGADG